MYTSLQIPYIFHMETYKICTNNEQLLFIGMNASKIVSNTAGKEVYHTRCIHFWAHEYVMSRQIPYFCQEHHTKIWSFL
jgi:hypothetical protein